MMSQTCFSRASRKACVRQPLPAHRLRVAAPHAASPAQVAEPVVSSATAPEELFKKAKFWIHNDGYFAPLGPESKALMDDEFVFRGVIFGPLNKEAYIGAIEGVKTYSAFPDIAPNPWGFCLDPSDPLRVWFFVQQTGTMTNDWTIAGATLPATGKKLQTGPATFNLIFTPEGKIKYYGVGYIADRIVSDAPGGSSAVALNEAFRTAGVPEDMLKWLFAGGLPQGAVRGAIAAASTVAGVPELGGVNTGKNLPAWFKALPNSKLMLGEGM